jgi:glycosyltransferase involved in cell wall biosynthesis
MHNIRLRIVGSLTIGGGPASELVALSKRLGVENVVDFVGWMSLREAFEEMRRASLCIIASERNGYTDLSLPHKLFQYILLGKPVLTANLTEVRRLFGNGIEYYDDNDPATIAKSIETIRENLTDFNQRALELRDVRMKELTWDEEARRYVLALLG